jgi:hypothetical protein
MKYLSIALGFLLLLGAAVSVPAAHDCIPDTGCAKGKWPPKCCKKPPCGLFRALQVSKAYRNLQRPRLGAVSPATASAEVTAQMQADLAQARNEIARCPEELDVDFGGQFQPDIKNDCQVSWVAPGSKPEVMSETQALQEINACSELIEAKHAWGRAMQPYCALRQRNLHTQGARIAITLAATQTQIDMLESQLQRYWNACTITFSAETARRVAEHGVEVLRDEAQLTEPPKEVPKRAKKKRRT